MPPVGFEPTISAGERPKTYALDRATTGTGRKNISTIYIYNNTSIKRNILTIKQNTSGSRSG